MPGRLVSFLGIRPGEERLAGWMVVLFATTQASQGLGANTADALFFVRFGVESLPLMILLSGPVVMAATIAHGAGLGRMAVRRWLPVILAGFAAWLLVERLGIAANTPAIYPVVWLGGQVVVLVSFTVMWTAAGAASNSRQARRLYPLFASAGIAGGVVGNALTGPMAAWFGTENLLLVQAALLAGAAMTAATMGKELYVQVPAPRGAAIGDLRVGFDITMRSPLYRRVAWAAGLLSLLFFLVVFPFSQVVTNSFASEIEVAGFLGFFSALATAGTFLVSLFLAKKIFARLGVVVTLLIVPVVYVLGFSLWMASLGLLTAALFRGVQWIAVNALGAAAIGALFNVLPNHQRGQVMAFVSGIPTQLGTLVGGGLLLAAVMFTPVQLSGLGLGLAIVAVLFVVRMRHPYSMALVEAVKQGVADVFTRPVGGPIRDPALTADALRTLTTALHSPEPQARAIAITLIGRQDGELAPQLLDRGLDDPDWRVRSAAVDALAGKGWPIDGERILKMVEDPAPMIRRRALEILANMGRSDDKRVVVALADPDPGVRANAAAIVGGAEGRRTIERLLTSSVPAAVEAGLLAMARHPQLADWDVAGLGVHPDARVRAAAARAMGLRLNSGETLRGMLEDFSPRVRAAAAAAIVRQPEGVVVLTGVLESGSGRATEAALHALAEAGHTGESLAHWASSQVSRASQLRGHRISLGTNPGTPTLAFLHRLLAAREERLARWALLATTTAKTAELMKVVSRGIWSADQETKARAFEALDSVGARAVTHCLIPLLEETVTTPTLDPRSSLRQLSSDRDPWLRALAVRSLGEELSRDLRLLRDVAMADQSGLVEAAVSRWRPAMVDESNTLDAMDRVIALQRVPMFSGIDPEDLEQIAAASSERRYDPDELIFREGEDGNDMLIIVSGTATITRTAHGTSRLIRTCWPGEHVGELSLLRNQPRSADVTSGPEGVHGLILSGEELQAILEDRPAVAMAMLATLAERLGSEGA